MLRPEAWLMIGHCGGLRPSQTIGDYVLAHAYLRDDHVLDDVLPVEIPIPAIAEVQTALYNAALSVTGEDEDSVKKRLRTGTVVTTDDRNWELRYTLSALRFNQSRAVAIDMESATVAAQGYRFRVPYGTLLCVSDKPLHGELKLPGQANAFYERAISQHLRIGIETLLSAQATKATACTAANCAASTSRRSLALAGLGDGVNVVSGRRSAPAGWLSDQASIASRSTFRHQPVRCPRRSREIVAAASQEIVDRHPIAAGRVDRLAVQLIATIRSPAGRARS